MWYNMSIAWIYVSIKGLKIKRLIFIFIFLFLAVACHARTITVDDDRADFNNIQAAIDDSNNGDTIIVADGVYKGVGNRDINFRGKAIVVRSENGPQNCIIDCSSIIPRPYYYKGFYFYNKENNDSIVDGFTIINGETGVRCGYWYDTGPSSPTITNCIIKNNADGIRCCFGSKPIISHCLIAGNLAKGWCGIPEGCPGAGGMGIDCSVSSPTIINCTIVSNRSLVRNNPELFNRGGVVCIRSSPTITNCIIRDNFPGPQIEAYKGIPLWQSNPLVTYNDVQGGWGNTGNIDIVPCFANPGYWDPNETPDYPYDDFWVNGDYHLKSQAGRWDPNNQSWVQDNVTSLCIDTGDPMSPIGLEPFPNGGIINMGAYGGTAEASKSYFGKPPCETIVAGDINGDCIVNLKDFALMAFHWLEEN
jgi:hypothetical protein